MLDKETKDMMERMLKRMFNLELHLTLAVVKLNEVIEELCDEESGKVHTNQVAHVMESFLETARDNNSRVVEAMERMGESAGEEDSDA